MIADPAAKSLPFFVNYAMLSGGKQRLIPVGNSVISKGITVVSALSV